MPPPETMFARGRAGTRDLSDASVDPDLHRAKGLQIEGIQRKRTTEQTDDISGHQLPSDGMGRALPAPVKAKMEDAFGTNFSAVRIYEGARSKALGAQAYTQGNEIHFAPGEYQPHTKSGQTLLGHELAHIVHQSQNHIPATTRIHGIGVNEDARLEREADEVGARAARGEFVRARNSPSIQTRSHGASIQPRDHSAVVQRNGDGESKKKKKKRETPIENVLRVCRGLAEHWDDDLDHLDAEKKSECTWALTGSAALLLHAHAAREEFRVPGDIDILVSGTGMLNAFFVLTAHLGFKGGRSFPTAKTGSKALTGTGLKVDLINVSRFGVAINFATDVETVLGVPVLKKEKLEEFRAMRAADPLEEKRK